MQKRPPRLAKTESDLSVDFLARYAEDWLLAGDIDQHSPRTLASRRDITAKLFWFFRRQGITVCGTHELRLYFQYLNHGHEDPAGRWGNARMTRPVKARTVHTYHGHLATFFRWMVEEGAINSSPMDRIPPPTARKDEIVPFSDQQLERLLQAARKTGDPKRDEAIVLFLVDTGIRASELCSLRMHDLDLSARMCQVLGKGNKKRPMPFGKVCARALSSMLRDADREADAPIFVTTRGRRSGESLTRSGLLQLFERLGDAAGIQGVRCSPHTARHTFAVSFLRAGGHTFALQSMLGHESLDMTQRYVRLAHSDIEKQHRLFSPADRLKRAR